MFRSGGVLKKDAIIWSGTPAQWPGWPSGSNPYGAGWGYSELYRRQLWVAVLVNKIAHAAARLPLKTYIRNADGSRDDGSDTPFGQLLANPSTMLDPYMFWLWIVATENIQGESFAGKIRDRGGRPVELVPLHPNYVRNEVTSDGRVEWSYDSGTTQIKNIPRRDLVHFRLFNPDSVLRGLSPLEPLRATLENEDGARRANSALWRNGGRPSVVLEHPGNLSQPAAERLSLSWAAIHSGVDNWAKAAVLEEGMKANVMALNIEELQYIEARKLNREEVCAAYDVPPPVVHILDRATYSNITAQMRSMYRDTMAPKLAQLESTLRFELRDGRFGDRTAEPDFGADVYAEFLLEGVLRGDFEARTAAYQAGIQSGWLMPAEVREMENLPFVEGSDQLLINGALTPLAADLGAEPPVDVVPTQPALQRPAVDQAVRVGTRHVLGKLGRCKSLDELDLNGLDIDEELRWRLEHLKATNTPIREARAFLAALLRGDQ